MAMTQLALDSMGSCHGLPRLLPTAQTRRFFYASRETSAIAGELLKCAAHGQQYIPASLCPSASHALSMPKCFSTSGRILSSKIPALLTPHATTNTNGIG